MKQSDKLGPSKTNSVNSTLCNKIKKIYDTPSLYFPLPFSEGSEINMKFIKLGRGYSTKRIGLGQVLMDLINTYTEPNYTRIPNHNGTFIRICSLHG